MADENLCECGAVRAECARVYKVAGIRCPGGEGPLMSPAETVRKGKPEPDDDTIRVGGRVSAALHRSATGVTEEERDEAHRKWLENADKLEKRLLAAIARREARGEP